MDWRHRSACLDEDPELFFPIGNTGPAILQIEEAKVVCRRCDVRSHAVLAVGSVATKDLEAYTIYQGNPAVPVRERTVE